jgi:hypothetical protein
MLIVATNAPGIGKKLSILMGILFVLAGSFGALFTMHIYMKRSPLPPREFRILGFPRRRPSS